MRSTVRSLTALLAVPLAVVLIVAAVYLPLSGLMVMLPLLGLVMNGTSSVLYGAVPDLAGAGKREQAFALFYTGTIGGGALAPVVFGGVGDALGVPVESEVSWPRGGASLYLRDPAGNVVELASPAIWGLPDDTAPGAGG